MKKGWIMYIGIFVLAALIVRGGCQPEKSPRVPANAVVTVQAPMPEGNPTVAEQSMALRVQVARQEKERATGLSEYKSLPASDSAQDLVHGMLYVYDKAEKRSFYEANTPFSLTTATLAEDGTIQEIKHTGPGPEEQKEISFEQPARLVLQVRRGWFADRGLGAGDRLDLPELAPEPAAPDAAPPSDTPVQADTPVQD
jgi:hypothetical protein